MELVVSMLTPKCEHFLCVTQSTKDEMMESSENKAHLPTRILLGIVIAMTGLELIGMVILGVTVVVASLNLPAIGALTDYRPTVPLRIFSADGVLIGEFGDERRDLVRINDIPAIMKKAVLAAEDNHFYTHGGVDYFGIMRAALNNLTGGAKQGASTITQQVARNFYLTNKQTYERKIYEVLLAWKIERNLSKDQILEAYMNQIYLGQRAYGFSAAAHIYFGKNLQELTIAEAAMLASLPKAPSAYNPVVNPIRAKTRQQYVLRRMHQLAYISDAEYAQAKDEVLKVKADGSQFGVHAEYVAEMARQLVYEQFGESAYTRGLRVYTTVIKADQDAAYTALRRGVMEYEMRHDYRGPEGYLPLPASQNGIDEALGDELAKHPASDDLVAAVVLDASPASVRALLSSGEEIVMTGPALTFAANFLDEKAPPVWRIKRGSIIRVMQAGGAWAITQMPEVEAAFVSANTEDGAIRSLVGGFDYNRNKFNRVTQAWRQPGSAFKPFIYSAALERGLSPATVVNDAPIVFEGRKASEQSWEYKDYDDKYDGRAWKPKNYDNKYDGPMSMREGLAKSKNMVSIRVLDRLGAKYGQQFATRFGFHADRNPPYMTLALGSGSVTPLQMAGAYSVFANGGYRVTPYLISRIVDVDGKVLSQARPLEAGDESIRAIDKRNAFLMDSMLKDVIRIGTATRALSLKRPDIAGKTGTTNHSYDAWFAGYQPKVVGISWIGFDQPKNLGDHETGGGLALPIWISYMQTILKDVPVEKRVAPQGLLPVGDTYYYVENPPGTGVESLGLDVQSVAN
jgi:penicillin-binding protein 1A